MHARMTVTDDWLSADCEYQREHLILPTAVLAQYHSW